MTNAFEIECALDLRAQLGEGPVWSAEEQALYFVDILGARVHRFVPETGAHTSWEAPDRLGFLLPVTDGTYLAGLRRGLHRFDPHDGKFESHGVVEPDLPNNRLNDGCVDPQGRLWFGTMDDEEMRPSGAIYCVIHGEDGLALRRHDAGYTVSNGPAVSPDGRTLYVCDSPEQVVYAFDIAPDCTLSQRRVFARFEHGYPDGVVTDSEGTLWLGVWGGGRVQRILPDGTFLPPIEMPVTNVTKVTFGGADCRTVYVTSARKGLQPDQLAREPQAGSIFTFRSDVPGIPQHRFALNS